MSLKNALLTLTLKKGIVKRISENARNEFHNDLINSNFERSGKINILVLIMSLFLLPLDILNKQKGLWALGSKYLFYTHISMILITLLLWFFSRYINKAKNPILAKQFFVMFFAYYVTLNCTLISIIDQQIHGQITLFIIGAYTIAVMNTFKPLTSLGIYLTNYLVFIIGITWVQDNLVIVRGHYVNGTILVAVAWVLSYIICEVKVRDFLSKKIIQHQKVTLEKANQLLTATNHQLQESLLVLDDTQNIVFSLAQALESKDPYTHGHSDRVAETAIAIAQYLELREVDQVNIYRAAILHDLGKIGIPDAILNKSTALTSEEWSIMKSHPERGAAICSKLKFAKEILPIIKHHHERYDGKGYPDGLKGESIPLLARIISIADTVDAMTSQRPYRLAGTFEQVLAELKKCAGTQFDPVLVEVALSFYKANQTE